MVFLGRAPEPRTVSVIKNSTTAITGVAGTFSLKDVGRSITGTAIPAATTLYAVASDTAATLSAAATASTTNAAVIGSDQSRVVTVTKSNSSSTIAAPAGTFSSKDVGRPIVGTNIPAAAILTTVTNDMSAALSAAATGSSTDSAVIGSAATYLADSLAYGFVGWSPETEAESLTYTVAAFNAGLTAPAVADNHSPVAQRSRG